MAVSLLSLDVIVPSVAIQYDTKETVAALRWGAQQVAEAARRIIRPKSRSKKMKRQGSLPGEAPVSLTGQLRKRISTRVRKRGNAIVARIIDSAIDPGRDGTLRPYSRFLETGSAGGGGRKGSTRGRVHRTRTFEERKRGATTRRIQEQRPYLSTALEQSRNMIKSRIEHAILHGIELKPTAKPARARKSPSAP